MTRLQGSGIWHPFTQHGLEPAPLKIARAEGAWLETEQGHRIFDAISSWWVVTHGHCHPRIVAAIQSQAATLDQVIFAGLTHAPAEEAASRLLDVVPKGLTHVFFSDSGSTSVEVAIKMALGYWKHRHAPRHRILALEHGYHGDTIGTMSAGARGVFNATYAPLLYETGRISFPTEAHAQDAIDGLERECRTRQPAAFVLEPLILGAGGMRIYGAAVLRELAAVCERFGVLMIADEVMTGFGRTGTMFACEQAQITPDILCLAKGLTGGAVPLAATVCTSEIYHAHVSDDRARMLFHSSSYTANPMACAAAAANLQIWSDELVLGRINDLTANLTRGAERLAADTRLTNVRQLGGILACDLAGRAQGYLSDAALTLRKASLARGVLLRPLGDTIYLMPPYCATTDEIDSAIDVTLDILSEVAA